MDTVVVASLPVQSVTWSQRVLCGRSGGLGWYAWRCGESHVVWCQVNTVVVASLPVQSVTESQRVSRGHSGGLCWSRVALR